MPLEIRTLTDGEKITEPGIYNIPLSVHHNQPCDGPSVTSGILRTMELHTPADVFAFHKLNPDRFERPETAALRLGRAMAAYVEGGEEALSQHFTTLPKDAPPRPTPVQLENYHAKGAGDLSKFMVLPDDKPRKPTAAQKAAAEAGTATDAAMASVEFWAKVEADGREPLSQKEADALIAMTDRVEFWAKIAADPRDYITDAEWTMLRNMGRALAADPLAAAVMDGVPEVTMAVQDERTGLWVLSRPDTVSFDGSMSDYKKVSTQGRPFTHRLCDSRIEQYGYHQQMALAADCYEILTGDRPSVVGVIFQTDTPPYHVIIREIDQEMLSIGSFQNRRAIRRFAECMESGVWPGPGEDIASFQMSDWRRTQLIAEMQIAGLAP